MKYKSVLFIFIAFLVVLTIFLFILFRNGDRVLSKGELFYDLDNASYVYDIEKKQSQKIEIKPYQNIANYFPYENGYFAIGLTKDKYGNLFPDATENYNNQIRRGDILYNDGQKTIVLSSEFSPNELVAVGDYLFFDTADDKLIAINLFSNKRVVVDEQFFNYIVIDSFLVYSTYNEDSTVNIYLIDCEKSGELKSKYIDEGIIKTNVNNELIYEKDRNLYHYSFKEGLSEIIDNYDFKKDSESVTYFGTFEFNKKEFDMFVNHPHFTNSKKADRMIEQGVECYFVPIYQRLMICSDNKKMNLPFPRDKLLRVNAFQEGSDIYYLNQHSLDYLEIY